MTPKPNRYTASNLRQGAKEAKQLARKLETRKAELKRQEAWERKEAIRALKAIAKDEKELQKFVEDFEKGEFDNKESKATLQAVKKLLEVTKDWGKDPTGVHGPEAMALGLALVIAALLKLAKKMTDESKKA